MDHSIHQFMLRGDVKKLLWLLGISFVVVLLVQFSEIPFGNLLSLMFLSSKSPPSEIADNVTLSSDLVPKNGTSQESNSSSDRSASGDLLVVTESMIDPSKGGYAPNEAMVVFHNGSSIDNLPSPAPAPAPASAPSLPPRGGTDNGSSIKDLMSSPTPAIAPITPLMIRDKNAGIYNVSIVPSASPVDKELAPSPGKDEKSGENSTTHSVDKKKPNPRKSDVLTIEDMDDLLIRSRSTYHTMKPRWSSEVDQELLDAKLKIENAPPILSKDESLYAPVYQNASMFKRSYELMEEKLQVYIYKEGEKPVFHQPSGVLQGIYASEGWFMKQLEENKDFVTVNATKAHLFYLPFSARMLEETLYVPRSHSRTNLVQYLEEYLDLIGAKYPFWNRTGGADHFLVGCHDWAPKETKEIMASCIRALCTALATNFYFGKDVSVPTTYIHNPQDPNKGLGGNPPSNRSVLAFFAGNMHGYVRPVLLQYWKDDPDMKIYGPLPRIKGKMSYSQHMKSSKYCICPRGFEVNSPRVVEAIFYECVPVIISNNYVPPFYEVLDWKSFAVFVLEKDIPSLKKILSSIPEKRYIEMQMGVKKVQQHFLWHTKPAKYDIFHMILHSVWYNRVLQINPR